MKSAHAVEHKKLKYRPKAVVVADWESRNGHILIDPSKVPCPEGCKCNACFMVALDKLVASSEEAANDSGTDSGINNEFPSHQL